MNKGRKVIYDKSDGYCWYCGEQLGEKGWHIDHFHPILRQPEYKKTKNGYNAVDTGKRVYPELDTEDNLVPSCAPCNLFKSTFDIEWFRSEILAQFDRLRSNHSGFRILERNKLVHCDEDGNFKFWFEKQGITMRTKWDFLGIHEDAPNIEWKFDKVDNCWGCTIGKYVVTLRMCDNCWVVIGTDSDWNQIKDQFKANGSYNAQIIGASFILKESGL